MAGEPTDEETAAALERMTIRDEMRSHDEIENTGVIEQRAEERVKASKAPSTQSVPAAARGIVYVLRELPPWGRVVLACLGVGLLGAVALTAGPAAVQAVFGK